MSLTLSVPAIDPVQPHSVETRPKQVTEWLERLPFASPIDAAQQLLAALSGMNRMQLGEADRYKLLTLYRPAIARISQELETVLVDSGIPPLAKQRQMGAILHKLMTEQAYGYKLVLLALTKRRFALGKSKLLPELTTHTLSSLSGILSASYRIYSPPPVGVWLEIHHLYRFARESGMADTKVAKTGLSPSLVYRQALLLALADPYHMKSDELDHARLCLDKFGHLSELLVDNKPHGFFIQTDHDHAIGTPPAMTGQEALWLRTKALCRHLHESTIKLKTGDSPRRIGLPNGMKAGLSQHLFVHLVKSWRAGARRAFKRFTIGGNDIRLITGVTAIYRMLDRPVMPSMPVSNDTLILKDMDTGLVFNGIAEASTWRILNDSAGGLALTSTPGAPLNLKVGDAAAIQENGSGNWSLSVIRWIKMSDIQRVEVGIERLAPQVLPILVRPFRGHRNASPEPALFIPGFSTLHQQDRLLLPRHVYQGGMDAEVWHSDRQNNITFGRVLEQTGGFDLIEFSVF